MYENQDLQFRFGGIARLYGEDAFNKLCKAHVAVIGLGGVGSWCVEALARSGVGRLTLIDADDICVSNVNRQIQALSSSVGCMKTQALRQRISEINPACTVELIDDFYSVENAQQLISLEYSYVVDAFDSAFLKAHLIAHCKEQKVPVITMGAVGGRQDPTLLKSADLADSTVDQLLMRVRKKLRQDFAFPRRMGQRFGVKCVYSTEPPFCPTLAGESSQEAAAPEDKPLDCGSGFGTASFVTGTMGFFAAHSVISDLIR